MKFSELFFFNNSAELLKNIKVSFKCDQSKQNEKISWHGVHLFVQNSCSVATCDECYELNQVVAKSASQHHE